MSSNGDTHEVEKINGKQNGDLSEDDNSMDVDDNSVTSDKSELEKPTSNGETNEKTPEKDNSGDIEDDEANKSDVKSVDEGSEAGGSEVHSTTESKPTSPAPSTQSDQQSKPPTPTPPAPGKPVKNKYAYLEKGIAESEELRPVAELLFGLGLSLAKQQCYEDLSRVHKKQKRKDTLSEHGEKYCDFFEEKYSAICEKNKALSLTMMNCKECTFRTESENVLQWHLEFAHGQDTNAYQCSFCDFVGKQPGEFFFHMEAEHNRKGRIYMKHAFFSCALCPFENNSRKALIKHQQKCERSFKMKRNLEPAPTDCDIPLKLVKPRPPAAKPVPKPPPISNTVRNIQQSRQQQQQQQQQSYMDLQAKMRMQAAQRQAAAAQNMLNLLPRGNNAAAAAQMLHQIPIMGVNNQRMNVPLYGGMQQMAAAAVNAAASTINRREPPPLQKAPKQSSSSTGNSSSSSSNSQTPSMPTGAASRFEICEICGGFVKDRESLRIHFYWAHKVDIQKHVFEKKQPHLMCEFCPQRFWTYQGLARHRQITHNKQQQSVSNSNSSSGSNSAKKENKPQTSKTPTKPQHNCILCGAVNVAHLLNHLSNAHNITLQTMFKQKRCLCCGASFAEEKLLERHMLSSHSDLFRIKPHSKKSPAKSSSPHSTGIYKQDAEKKSVGCPMCKAKFPSSAEFDEHFAKMHSYKCHRCKQVYSAQDMVSKHWHEVHAKESEPCQVCDENVRIGRPYIRHLRSNHLDDFSLNLKPLNKDVVTYLLTRKRPASYSKPMPKFMKLRAKQGPGPRSMKVKAVPSPPPVIESEADPKLDDEPRADAVTGDELEADTPQTDDAELDATQSDEPELMEIESDAHAHDDEAGAGSD